MAMDIKEIEKFIAHSSNKKESRSNGNPPTIIWMETKGRSCSFLENPSLIIKVAIANAITAIKHRDNPYKFKFTVILGAKIIELPKNPTIIPITLKKCILSFFRKNEIIATNMGSKLATITAR